MNAILGRIFQFGQKQENISDPIELVKVNSEKIEQSMRILARQRFINYKYPIYNPANRLLCEIPVCDFLIKFEKIFKLPNNYVLVRYGIVTNSQADRNKLTCHTFLCNRIDIICLLQGNLLNLTIVHSKEEIESQY